MPQSIELAQNQQIMIRQAGRNHSLIIARPHFSQTMPLTEERRTA